MSILDDYMQLQMIENVKKIKEMELCYKSNLKLCKQQEKQINKLATAIEKIKEICKTNVCKHCHSKLKVDDNYCKNIKDCDCYNILQICDEVNE